MFVSKRICGLRIVNAITIALAALTTVGCDLAGGPPVLEEGQVYLSIEAAGKDVQMAREALAKAAKDAGFKVLGVHDQTDTLKAGQDSFPGSCVVVELTDPVREAPFLAAKREVATLLPLRVAIFTAGDGSRLVTLRPSAVIPVFRITDMDEKAKALELDLRNVLEAAAK